MQRKKIPLRTGFNPVALVHVLSLHDSFGRLKNDKAAMVHYGIVSHLVAQERQVAALLGVVDDLTSPHVTDTTDEVLFEISKLVKSVGGRGHFNDIKKSISDNRYILDRSCIPPFKQSFLNNPEFTAFAFRNSAILKDQNLAKLKLRFIYLVSIYQTTLQHEYKRKILSTRINKLERESREAKSQRRIKRVLAGIEERETEAQVKEQISQLEIEFQSEKELSELDTKQIAWIPRLQKLIEIKSAAFSQKLEMQTRMLLFPGKDPNDSKLSSGAYIYQLIDEMESEDRRIDPFAI